MNEELERKYNEMVAAQLAANAKADAEYKAYLQRLKSAGA